MGELSGMGRFRHCKEGCLKYKVYLSKDRLFLGGIGWYEPAEFSFLVLT